MTFHNIFWFFKMCPLVIGSFGYSAEDVVFKWKQPKAVSIDKLGLAQFHLGIVSHEISNNNNFWSQGLKFKKFNIFS